MISNCTRDCVHFYAMNDDLDDENNIVHTITSELSEFLDELPSIHIHPDKVDEVQVKDYDKMNEELELKITKIREDKVVQEKEYKVAQEKLEEQHKQELAEEEEKSRNLNIFGEKEKENAERTEAALAAEIAEAEVLREAGRREAVRMKAKYDKEQNCLQNNIKDSAEKLKKQEELKEEFKKKSDAAAKDKKESDDKAAELEKTLKKEKEDMKIKEAAMKVKEDELAAQKRGFERREQQMKEQQKQLEEKRKREPQTVTWVDPYAKGGASTMCYKGSEIVHIKAWCVHEHRKEGLVGVVEAAYNHGWIGKDHQFTIAYEDKYAYYAQGKKNRDHSRGGTRDNWCDSTGDSHGSWPKKYFYKFGIQTIKDCFE